MRWAPPNAAITLDVRGWGRGFATRYTFGGCSVGVGGSGAMPDIANTPIADEIAIVPTTLNH
jgi:hypothetical protein